MSTAPLALMPAHVGVPLERFVEDRHPSVRLRNALQCAAREGAIPFATVDAYLADPNPQAAMMRCVKNLGRRSANELDRIIRVSRSEGGQFSVVDPGDVVTTDEIDDLLAAISSELSTVPARAAVRDVREGGRLERLLESQIGEIPVWTLCNDIETVTPQITRVPGIGQGTVNDLVAGLRLTVSRVIQRDGVRRALHDAILIRLFGDTDGPIWMPEPGPDPEQVSAAETVRALLDGMTVAQAFSSEVLAARLRQLVWIPQVSNAAVAELLLDRQGWNARLGRFGNIGRTTMLGFWDVCWRRLAAAATDLSVEERNGLALSLGIEPERLVARDDDLLAMAVSEGDDCAEVAARVAVPRELDALVQFLFERIQSRDVPVIRRRFGLDGAPPETLEEIGGGMRVTRERVRQIEKRGLRDMALMSRRVPLRQAIDDRATRTWTELAGDGDVLLETEFYVRRRHVAGATMLSLELLGLTLSDWLDEMGSRFGHGWLSVGADRHPVDHVLAHLDASGLPALPCAVDDLGLDAPAATVHAALQIGLDLRIHAGYAVEGRFSVRPRRTLGVHALLSGSRSPLPSAELLRRYRACVPADRCSQRDLSIVMSEASHLFLEISEERWIALGRAGTVPVAATFTGEEDEEQTAAPELDGSLAAALVAELEKAGPQALGQLTTNPRRWLPRDRSVNSIAPTLIMRPDLFIRLLPGVYCLPQQVPSHEEVVAGEIPYLLDETQARLFAMARRAGEPWGTFPLWTPAAEMRLCRWADRSEDGELLRSLLAIATIDAWPADADELSLWRDRRRSEARFDLFATLRPGALETRPALERLLAALVDLDEARATNWMALNRVDGRRIDMHSGCALLGTLIMLGAVSQPDQCVECPWQLPHPLVPARAAELRSMLATELHRTGSLEWPSAPGASVACAVRSSEVAAPSWLDLRRFRAAFDTVAVPEGEVSAAVSMADVSAAGSRLLAERRMGDLLDWLGEQ
jgi:hypothetical protein